MLGSEKADPSDGPPRRIDVELLIVHPTMTPTEITDALGFEAHAAHRAGDLRRTSKGASLNGRYQDTRWRHCVRYELRDQWFADKIAILLDRLVPHRAFFHHVRATGGSAVVVVQFLGDGYVGDNVPLAMLSRMAELQLDLGIECFNVPQS